ncbi:MAG: hypothetical protein NUV48_07070 [Peptococcaceae bacterium]|nr:hypothetical protein [Peptococcaceae bacterium]
MPGVLFLVMAVISALVWFNDPAAFCSADACREIPGFLGRSWYLWAALYYSVAAAVILAARRNKLVLLFLAGGVAFHAALVVVGYALTRSVCVLCLKFFALEVCLTVLYGLGYLLDFYRPAKTALAGVSSAFVLAALALLVANPAPWPAVVLAQYQGVSLAELNREEPAPRPEADARNASAAADRKPAKTEGVKHRYLQVLTPEGQSCSLDISCREALLFATWCSHCDDALKEAAKKPPEERPYLVVTYLRDNEEENAREKLSRFGLEGERFYFLLEPPAEVKKVPSILQG